MKFLETPPHVSEMPSMELASNGSRVWRLKSGIYHCDGKPAVIEPDGRKIWLYNGRLHRVGAPAVENADGTVEFWVNGRYVSDGSEGISSDGN